MTGSSVPHSGDPLRVAYVGFTSGSGGDALQMLSLAHGMQVAGHDVDITVPAGARNATFVDRCRARDVPARQSELLTATGPGSRQRLRALTHLVRSFDHDVVHVHSGDWCLPRSLLIALLPRPRRPFVATLHSPHPPPESRTSRTLAWSIGARLTLSAVISPSDHATLEQRACGVPARLVETIHNAVEQPPSSAPDREAPRRQLGVADDVPLVVFSSRLDAQKRPLDAVHAFATVAPHHPTAVLAMVGIGDLRDTVRAEADRLDVGDRVVMVGYQRNVADWLAAASAWIFPTERENFSIALLEALAAGCAIVATDCPGNDEVLVDESNALTFRVGDVAAAAAALDRVLADRALAARLGRSATETAASFSIGEMVARYTDTYRRAIGSAVT